MILTNCAACAAPLAHTAPRCVRCHTRYCNKTCQHDHWRRGHKQICKRIHRGGNAEQYHADKKYKEAVAVAVEKCAEDVKGQTCYICTQALHWKTKEGLVRGCSCRGTSGFAHISCLAEQAKILWAEAEENNLDLKARTAAFRRWDTCSLCMQEYHGVVRCALGWACWKTYVGRPEADQTRRLAMGLLGLGLSAAEQIEDALSVQEATLSMLRHLGVTGDHVLAMQTNISNTYFRLGRLDEALRGRQDVYSERLKLNGEECGDTILAANNYAVSLLQLERFEDAKSMLCKTIPVARRVLGEDNDITLKMRSLHAQSFYKDPAATLDSLREAVSTLEDTARTRRRVFGGDHSTTFWVENDLLEARATLRAREPAPLHLHEPRPLRRPSTSAAEKLAQDAFRTARAKLAQERSELAQTLAAASARPPETNVPHAAPRTASPRFVDGRRVKAQPREATGPYRPRA